MPDPAVPAGEGTSAQWPYGADLGVMGPLGLLLVGLAILVGLAGIVLPVLPGLALIVAAVLVWAVVEGGTWAWIVAAAALLLAGAGTLVRYLVPKRRLSAGGVPNRTLLLAVAAAVVGFFLIPVAGAVIGFVAAVYLLERRRLGPAGAWPSTRLTLGAVAASIGIELAAGLLIAGLWLGAVVVL